MAPHALSVKESIGAAWRIFKTRPWFFVGTTVVIAIIQMVLGALQEQLGDVLGFVVSLVLSTLLYTGILNLYLRAYDNASSAKYQDLWNPKPFWKYLGLSILLLVIVGIGFILLIIPGVILALMFFAASYLVIEKGLNPIAALKESMRLTRGNRVKLLLLGLALAVLMILGMIPLFLGLLVAAPVAALAGVHAYRKLSGSAPAPVAEAAPAPAPAA